MSPPLRAPRLTAVSLQLHDPDALLRAATRRGYTLATLESSALPARPPARGAAPPLATAAEAGWLLLQHPTGRRLALEQTAYGRLVLHTAGERQHVYTVVRYHTLDHVRALVATHGLRVQRWPRGQGAVSLLATASDDAGQAQGTAVALHIQADGCVEIETERMVGPPWGPLVTALAVALGGVGPPSALRRPPPWCGDTLALNAVARGGRLG